MAYLAYLKIKLVLIGKSTRSNTQSELTAKVSDPKLSGALLNSVNSSSNTRRISHYCNRRKQSKVSKATENQTMSDQHASNPQHSVTTVMMEARGVLFPSISHVPNVGTSICFPYPGLAGVKLLAYAGWVLLK